MPPRKSKVTVDLEDNPSNDGNDSDMSQSLLQPKPTVKKRKILNQTVLSPKMLRSKQPKPKLKKGIATPTAAQSGAQSGAQSDGDIFDSDGKKTFFYLF